MAINFSVFVESAPHFRAGDAAFGFVTRAGFFHQRHELFVVAETNGFRICIFQRDQRGNWSAILCKDDRIFSDLASIIG